MLTVRQLNAVSDVSPGDMRAVLNLLFESGPLNDDSTLTPDATAIILLFSTLERLGYERSRIYSFLKPFVPNIRAYANEHQDLHVVSDLGLLVFGDSRYVFWAADPTRVYDMKEDRLLEDLPSLPTITVTISTLGLLRGMFAKLARLDAEEAARQAAGASADTASDS